MPALVYLAFQESRHATTRMHSVSLSICVGSRAPYLMCDGELKHDAQLAKAFGCAIFVARGMVMASQGVHYSSSSTSYVRSFCALPSAISRTILVMAHHIIFLGATSSRKLL
jgi:hypothetical protein